MIRSACVARDILPSGAWKTVYTVPTGYVLILKDVHMGLNVQSATQVAAALESEGGQARTLLFLQNTDPLGNYFWAGWVVLNAGDYLQLLSVTNPGQYWVSGAVLPFNPAV